MTLSGMEGASMGSYQKEEESILRRYYKEKYPTKENVNGPILEITTKDFHIISLGGDRKGLKSDSISKN